MTTSKRVSRPSFEVIRQLVDKHVRRGTYGNLAMVIGFDGSQASACVTVNGDSTPYQVADFRHCDRTAAIKLAREQGLGDGDTIYVVGSYWDNDKQEWYTSISKYVYRTR